MRYHSVLSKLGRFLLVLVMLVSGSAQSEFPNTNIIYVSPDGRDSMSCGLKKEPCRSISQALILARHRFVVDSWPSRSGKILRYAHIRVWPGVYGDLNGNGELGEPGEEIFDPDCNCAIKLDVPLTLFSERGYGSTVIDVSATGVNAVSISADGTRLGAHQQGFTIRASSVPGTSAVVAMAPSVSKVRGNMILAGAVGIDSENAFIEHNLVIGGNPAIRSTNGEVTKNVVVGAVGDGLVLANSSATGNAVTHGGAAGIRVNDVDAGIGENSIVGNLGPGIVVAADIENDSTSLHPLRVTRNNLLDNDIHGMGMACGVANQSNIAVHAHNNYWGLRGDTPNIACDMGQLGLIDTSGALDDLRQRTPTSPGPANR